MIGRIRFIGRISLARWEAELLIDYYASVLGRLAFLYD
jgi:hypothetical protein